jgi:hypothetical protein
LVDDVHGDPEVPFAAGENVVVVLVPAEPVAGAQRLSDRRLGAQDAQRQLARTGTYTGPFASVTANTRSSVIAYMS